MINQRADAVTTPYVFWTENDIKHRALWRSEAGFLPPTKIQSIDASCSADKAFGQICQGIALLWRGDYHHARQMLVALDRRLGRKRLKASGSITERFHQHRMKQAQRAITLGRLLVPVNAGHQIELKRAPDVQQACTEVYGSCDDPYLISLRELLGVIGAHEWRKKGVWVDALDAFIYPHYGVFSPVRGEYLKLLAQAPLPEAVLKQDAQAFDIGTGTGVLAAILAKRGISRIIATDCDKRALACATENIDRLGLAGQIDVQCQNLFPSGRATLIVCNPPWLPGKPSSSLEGAIYDPESKMLESYLAGLKSHLDVNGEAWLILSNLAVLLGLRSETDLFEHIDKAGLHILERHEERPHHKRAQDQSDPLHEARSRELTTLFRLAMRG